jgi:hypothetical protein
MTGPEMHDVVDWLGYLDGEITSVEEPGTSFYQNQSTMYHVAMTHGVDGRLTILRAKVEYVITHGKDLEEDIPPLSVLDSGFLRFEYDVINLDFDGGIGSVQTRVRAIEQLIRRQNLTECVLFITFNVRHRLPGPIAAELDNLRQRLDRLKYGKVLHWYSTRTNPEAYRLKATIPGIISHQATAAQLDCEAYPPVMYIGSGHQTLVHFAFYLKPRPAAFRGQQQTDHALLALPMIEVKDARLRIAALQAPDFTLGSCRCALLFLGQAMVASLIKDYESRSLDRIEE